MAPSVSRTLASGGGGGDMNPPTHQCVIDLDTRRVMASLRSSSSHSESSTPPDDELQGLDDNLTQAEGLTSDSDDEYLPENDSEASSDDQYESDGDDEETPPSPSPHTFTLMADPFSDHRPGTVPALVEDYKVNKTFFFSMFNAFLYVESLTILCQLAFI